MERDTNDSTRTRATSLSINGQAGARLKADGRHPPVGERSNMPSRCSSLSANARPFRFAFYPFVAIGFLLFGMPGVAQAAAVTCWCLFWPLLADRLTRTADARRNLRVHLLEALLACFLFAAAGMQPALLAAVCIVLIMSNALQGGLRQACKCIACGAPGLAGGFLVEPPAALPDATAAYAGLLLLAYCALVAHVAFARVLTTHGSRTEARARNERLQQYLPHTLAGRVAAAERPRLERRWLVIVFTDLTGFTAMVERLEMEEVATMLDGYLRSVATVTRRWRGAVSKVIGDGVLLVFGEEGNRSRRQLVGDALGCCADLHEALAQISADWLGRGLPGSARVKTGIASGYCSLGDWGGGGRLEYTVIGHPVNLASRLQNLAGVSETLLCERTALLADVPLSPPMRNELKGLGEVNFRRAEPAGMPCANGAET